MAPDFSINQSKAQLRAQNLLEELDADFILATKFLADILSIISYYAKYFNQTIPKFVKEFANVMMINLQYRFTNTELYNAMHIFDFKQVPTTMRQMSTFAEEEIIYLAKYYGEDRIENGQVFSAIVNKHELIK
ncbi:43136_t:CDS:2 [Gigaspora margarita]|uniref:43136_t:CDS:1 n=1 Tax=Gigaspora margarita TaxID=4874 RepID=A0ABM8VXI2_GIGMA|nr:43136_t:CDS:2 [Gigaspora margarita]